MQITTRAIVLSSLKYGDTSLIVRAFTESDGLKSYLLKGVLASKKGRIKAAYFQPLTQLELVVNHRNKGSLEHIREVRLNYAYESIHTAMSKNAIAIFLAEVLVLSIHEEERNLPLFRFLEASLQWLDTGEETANFHLLFLLELTRFLGFYPDRPEPGSDYFDLSEGIFIEEPPLGPYLSGKELNHLKGFLGTNFDAISCIKLGQKSRNSLLQSLLVYYELHLQGFRKPRSLAILNEVFS